MNHPQIHSKTTLYGLKGSASVFGGRDTKMILLQIKKTITQWNLA
jgi:hypothetical protein